MKLIFKQRFFSWFDSYDIYYEDGSVAYTVKGQLSWGKCLNVYNASDEYLGTVKQRVLTFLPKYEIYLGDQYAGVIRKEFSFFKPSFDIDYLGWHVDGNFFEWDYTIYDASGYQIATVTKEVWNFTDTYIIDVRNPDFALNALMLVIAIDAEKDTRN